jgi:hypothetical protein
MTDLQTWKLSAKPEDEMLASDAGLKWDSRTEPTTPGIESLLAKKQILFKRDAAPSLERLFVLKAREKIKGIDILAA